LAEFSTALDLFVEFIHCWMWLPDVWATNHLYNRRLGDRHFGNADRAFGWHVVYIWITNHLGNGF